MASAQRAHLQPDGQCRPRGNAARGGAAITTAASNGRAAVVVTGASGSLGRPLCAHLARRGSGVRALVRDPDSFAHSSPSVQARCDLPDTIDESLLQGARALVRCAYATRETHLARARRVNEEGTRRLVDACRRVGLRCFVSPPSSPIRSRRPTMPAASARSKASCSWTGI
ncbi:MAG: NAD-dependent epimerase/dehydratase family protein [Deltaproteobacteria bacterium]|nr:MAG: NAD-dependent epimerase/dehydratase family protein [Deltaproteobacteria bacterium]